MLQPMTPIVSDADIARGLATLVDADPRLVEIVARSGPVPLRRTEPGFASLASIIVSQQVSRQSADAIWARLVRLIAPLEPERFIEAGEEAWREAELSRPKQRTLVALSHTVMSGDIDLHHLCRIDGRMAMEQLTAIKGIGPWTAEIYLMFAAGHPDIFPAGDVALQQSVADAFGLDARPDDSRLRAITESWAPWRSVAARLFWAFYSSTRKRDVMP
jgi:DNA-3-methyladenine glycosylase II